MMTMTSTRALGSVVMRLEEVPSSRSSHFGGVEQAYGAAAATGCLGGDVEAIEEGVD
jgi:hypothetical protein